MKYIVHMEPFVIEADSLDSAESKVYQVIQGHVHISLPEDMEIDYRNERR